MSGKTLRCGAQCALVLVAMAARAGAQVPSPESVFGFAVATEGRLIDYDESIAYFRQLEQATDRVRVLEVGRTSFGRPWFVALISSAQNLADLERLKAINQRLAHPAGLTDAEALALAREGRAFVDISGGLHASEIAGAQHTPQLAYELLTAESAAAQEILDNTVLFLWPTINPDGQDIVVEWCRAREAGQDPAPMELYQKYIGHDNNRDSYMLNVIESRVIQRVWREWEPHIIYVHHQSSPEPTRIWLPPFADPVGLHAPPIAAREINTIGMTIAQELDANGQPGAVHMLESFDAWYPGYVDYMPVYHNIPAFWTETQGSSCTATKAARDADSFPPDYRALRPSPLYLSPWDGSEWTQRDAVDYMVTASEATLKYAAKFKDELLYNRYQAGRNTIAKYRARAPHAYIVPQAQHDPVAPVELLRRLAFMGVRVMQTTRELSYEGETLPAGTWVVPMDQEFGELVRTLLEVQRYPDMGEDTPYDAAGWTLPFQLGVRVIEGTAPLDDDFRAALRPVRGEPLDWRATPDDPFTTNGVAAGMVPAPGGITGSGDAVVLDPAQNNAFRVINRVLAAGGSLRYAPSSGRYVVTGVERGMLERWAGELWVRAERVPESSLAGARPAGTRIGLYKASAGNMDVGWTEWLLDTFEFNYTVLTPEDLRSGKLRDRFDVIVFGSQNVGGGGGRGGRGGGGGRGGAAGDAGESIDAVDAFVRAGGSALFWSAGAAAAIGAFELPVRNVVAGLPRQQHFTGISIMEVETDPSHPVMAGMPARADVVVSRSPVFETLDGFEGSVLAGYPAEASPLRSGFLSGPEHMQGRAAALEVPRDGGRLVLLAFQPQWRGQPMGTFRVVFNALLTSRRGG
jgi:hypothetical protein